ncbi:MAG: hypothetical protein AAF244_01880 [Pseudomonadota bacterium]
MSTVTLLTCVMTHETETSFLETPAGKLSGAAQKAFDTTKIDPLTIVEVMGAKGVDHIKFDYTEGDQTTEHYVPTKDTSIKSALDFRAATGLGLETAVNWQPTTHAVVSDALVRQGPF